VAVSRRGRHPRSLTAIQPPPNPAEPGNLRSVTHGAYSGRLKAPRVREVLEELLVEHPQEAPANLRALAELFVTAERLSEWVAEREDLGVSVSGTVARCSISQPAWSRPGWPGRRAAAHIRDPTTYPARDDEGFLKHSIVRWADGRPRLDSKPVTITKWQPDDRKY
jgi:hypothetical protein